MTALQYWEQIGRYKMTVKLHVFESCWLSQEHVRLVVLHVHYNQTSVYVYLNHFWLSPEKGKQQSPWKVVLILVERLHIFSYVKESHKKSSTEYLLKQ